MAFFNAFVQEHNIAPGKITLAEQQGLLMPIFQEDALQKMSLIEGHSLSGSNLRYMKEAGIALQIYIYVNDC